MSIPDTPGFGGLLAITAAVLVTSVSMSIVTGSGAHWPFVLAGLGAGWLSTKSINK